jgi:hypothetical protein
MADAHAAEEPARLAGDCAPLRSRLSQERGRYCRPAFGVNLSAIERDCDSFGFAGVGHPDRVPHSQAVSMVEGPHNMDIQP